MSDTSIHWRDYEPADEHAMVAGFIATYNAEPWFDNWTTESATTYLAELLGNSRAKAFVCTIDGTLAAAVILHARTFQDDSEVYVDELFVFPEFQGRGLGKSAILTVREFATSIGAPDIVLLTDRDKPAFDFYVKNGFHAGEQQVFMIG